MSQELTRLATTAIDEFSELVRLQSLLEMCAEQVFASPSLSPQTMQERVGLLLGYYLEQVTERKTELEQTLQAIGQLAARSSEFEGVRQHG